MASQQGHLAPARDMVPAPGHGARPHLPVMLPPSRGSACSLGNILLNAEDHPGFVGVGFHGESDPLVVLFAEPTGLEQRHRGPAILALHRPGPEIGHRGLAIHRGVKRGQLFSRLF